MPEKKKGVLIVLKEFFGNIQGQSLRDFKAEVDKLSESEKIELARLAVSELDLSQDEVDFSLESD